MTLHQLRIFECVARHMNITKASRALHVSQPSASQQLKLLEQEFGTQFLVRRNHGIELTAQGRKFIDAVKPVLSEAASVENTFWNNPRTKQDGYADSRRQSRRLRKCSSRLSKKE
jgi:DNA-binding transcriptional LysR family regulator